MSIPSIPNIPRKNVLLRFHTFQNIHNQYDLRKSYINHNNNMNNNLYQNLLSGNYNTSLNDIFKLIIEEAKTSHKPIDSFNSIKLLEIYIRKNRSNIDLIVKKIIDNEINLDENILTYIIELVQNLITENNKSINFLQKIIPFLINMLSKNIDINGINKVNLTLKHLIKLGGNNTRKIVEDNLEALIKKFTTDKRSFKYETTKLSYIQFFFTVLKSSPAIFYSYFTQNNNMKSFWRILDNFQSSKQEVRIIIGKLIMQFISMITNRDKEMKYNYPSSIYIHIYSQYEKHLKENNDTPNNLNLFSGLCIVLIAIYLSFPVFFKNKYLYSALVDNIFKAKNSKNNLIKIEFINFVPYLYNMNKELFVEKYINFFLDLCVGLLNIRTNIEILNSLFLALGNMSLLIKPKIFSPVVYPLLNLFFLLLTEKKIYEKEIFKCLSDLINNKDKMYMEKIMQKFELNFLLSKLFKTKLSTYKIDFLKSLMNFYDKNSIKNITTVIISLNVISLIFCDEDFNFKYFNETKGKTLDKNILDNIEKEMVYIRKNLRKFFSQKNEDSDNINENNIIYNIDENKKDISFVSKSKCLNDTKILRYGLNLLSKIENEFFYKDILIFYKEKIFPLLYYINDTTIIKKILNIILCKYVKVYDDDKNYFEYVIKGLLDGLKNLIFTCDDISVVLHGFHIIHQKIIFLDLILADKKFFFNKFFGMLYSNEIDKRIKEQIIQTIGLLGLRAEDKSYFIALIKKNIINLIFSIENNDDIIQKENNVLLLLYYCTYVKFFLDFNLIEKIMEININLLLNNENPGIIWNDILNIFCELLNTDIISNNYNQIKSDKFEEYLQFLLIICILQIKDSGITSTKKDISLKILYQIIKIKKLDIYPSFSPKISSNLNQSLTNSLLFKEKANEEKNSNNINDINNLLSLEKGEKINLVEILLQNMIKGDSERSLSIIMNIFGLCGVLEPSKMERYFSNRGLSIYHLEDNLKEEDSLEDNDYKFIITNKKYKKIGKEIDISNIDNSTSKAILLLMRILKENSQQEVTMEIMSFFSRLIRAISENEANLIDIILPTLIEVMPNFEIKFQSNILENINLIIKNFKNKIKFYLDDIIQLIIKYIANENFLNIILSMLFKLFTDFVNEMETYYYILIPIFLSILKKNQQKETREILKIFLLMAENENIVSYLNIMLGELVEEYIIFNDEIIIKYLLDFMKKIILYDSSNLFYRVIINILLKKLKNIIDPKQYAVIDLNKLSREKKLEIFFKLSPNSKLNFMILNGTLNIFRRMNMVNSNDFIEYLPFILTTLKETNILYYSEVKQKIKNTIIDFHGCAFLSKKDFLNQIFGENCTINCIQGFNANKKFLQSLFIRPLPVSRSVNVLNTSVSSQNISQMDITKSSANLSLGSQTYSNRKNKFDNEKIIRVFNNTQCSVEEDWYDWFKSSSKILFEESPSFILLTINSLSEYYFPLILELYNYAFLTVYTNNNDKNKEYLTNMLINAINNDKTPNDILLTILNLIEFIERRNINLSYIDYNQFGNVSTKCRAFAKALYYKENYFLIKNDFEQFEDLLELYYEVKLEESAKGLLEQINNSIEKNNQFNRKQYYNIGVNNLININLYLKENNKYIWYIKVHDYEKALKLINEQLLHEENKENLETLKKNRIVCLNGLCDWENLFSEGSAIVDLYGERNSNNNNNPDDTSNNQKIIEEEIILSKACMNLSEWSELKNHFSKIYSLFKSNSFEISEQNILIDNEDLNINLNLGKKSEINEDDKAENEINTFIRKTTINLNADSPDIDLINENSSSFNINNIMNNSKYINNEFFSRKKSFIIPKDNNKKNNIIISNDNINNEDNNNNNEIEENIDFISYNKIINTNNSSFAFMRNSIETIFDLNLYSSIININETKYETAMKFISSAKKIILSNIKSLLTESYTRGYELLIKNQQLCLLEQIIEYKQFHENDDDYLEQMVKYWDRGLNMAGIEDPNIYEKFLSIRALVLPIEKEFEKYMNLSKIYRKKGMYYQCEQILNRMNKKLFENEGNLNIFLNNDNNIFNDNIDNDINEINLFNNNSNNSSDEKKIRINLGLNKCLFEKGAISDAVERSEHLVKLLNQDLNINASSLNSNTNLFDINNMNENIVLIEEADEEKIKEYEDLSKLNDKLKSKIYGSYAIYMQSFHNLENFNKIAMSQEKKEIINFTEYGRRTLLMNSNRENLLIKTSAKNLETIKLNSEEGRKTIPKEEGEEMKNLNWIQDINKNFLLATRYDNTNFSLWHTYAMFNYKLYKSLLNIKNKEKNKDENITLNNIEKNYAVNAIEGFKYSIIIGRHKKKNIFQDLLRLIDIFFDPYSANSDLIDMINASFNEIEADSFLIVLPQLLCRFNLEESNVLSILISLLIKIGKTYPRSIIFNLIVMKYSNSKKRISMAQKVLNAIINDSDTNKKLVEESEMFIRELNNCAILLHEQWSEAIEETSKMYYNKDYSNTVKHLIKLHKKMYQKPENLYDINFYQKFRSQIFDAEYKLKEYIDTNNVEPLGEAWDIYIHLYANISNYYKKFEKMSLDYISNKLYKLQNSNIFIPGSYSPLFKNFCQKEEQELSGVKIKKIGKILKIFNTKQHPRQLTMIGKDDKEYMFLLKGHEDLHQDERVMQLFTLVNTIIADNQSIKDKNLFIDTFSVLPLSHSTGIIGWVPNCDTLHQLIKEKREMSHFIQNNENKKLHKIHPKYETAKFMNKVEIFKETIKDSKALEIKDMIWIKSKNCETWLIRRTNYSRSLAVMSMVGYILGLGDRHPSNLMMSRKTGKIIHIDFGDCFEVAMKRDKFPEKVPFRLTKMLVKALEASGVGGTFKIISEKIMELLRTNKDSLLAILGSFLYDPLISFKLMIPMIIKQKRLEEQSHKKKKNKINDNDYKDNGDNYDDSKYMKSTSSTSLRLKRNHILNLNNFHNNNVDNNDINEENDLINSPKKKDKVGKIGIINDDKEKNEKKMMENDERHIFNLYEENDEIESEELNRIAKIVLERIEHKLSGTDFSPEIIFDIKRQVERLINEAVSYENLAQSYLGWCPFW